MSRYWRKWGAVIFIAVTSLACTWLQVDPETTQKYPWLVQPVRPETKAYFCERLDLDSEHPVCQADRNVLALDLLRALQERFPVDETPYSEVEEVLSGYPVEAEESITPDGTVTSRAYVYLLTEFDGFCVYFFTDLQTGTVTRIGSTSIGSGPSSAVCGSLDLRSEPRPFLLTPAPQNTSTPTSP